MFTIGCHLSSTKGNLDMVRTAEKIGANTFAFFTRNPRGSKAKPLDVLDCQRAMERLEQLQFGKLVAHGSYTMNLCTGDPEARAFAAGILAEDLERMANLPGQYYNVHPGSHVGQGSEAGIDYIAQALRAAMAPDYPVTVLLETMAGKALWWYLVRAIAVRCAMRCLLHLRPICLMHSPLHSTLHCATLRLHP